MNIATTKKEVGLLLRYIYAMEAECDFCKASLYEKKAELLIDKLQELVK